LSTFSTFCTSPFTVSPNLCVCCQCTSALRVCLHTTGKPSFYFLVLSLLAILDIWPTQVSVPLYYGSLEVVVLAVFSLYSWKAGWTYAPARARDVLFTVNVDVLFTVLLKARTQECFLFFFLFSRFILVKLDQERESRLNSLKEYCGRLSQICFYSTTKITSTLSKMAASSPARRGRRRRNVFPQRRKRGRSH